MLNKFKNIFVVFTKLKQFEPYFVPWLHDL